jgi:hypothetical protein
MSLSLDTLDASLLAIQIKEAYNDLDWSVQKAFVNYLQDEFAAIDDEFSIIINDILNALASHSDIEEDLEVMFTLYPADKIKLVLQSIYDYLQDVYYD